MKLRTMILAALLAVPLAAQQPAVPPDSQDPQGPGWGWQQGQGPGWGQGMGPGMRMGPGMHRGPQGRGPRGPRGGPGAALMGAPQGLGLGLAIRDPQLREHLGLTAEQVSRLEAGQSEFAKAQVRRRAELQVKRMELAELLRADKADRAAIERKMREVHEAEFANRKAALDHQFAMRDVLTPEQHHKLRQWREQNRGRMQERFRERQGPRGPWGPGNPPDFEPPETELS